MDFSWDEPAPTDTRDSVSRMPASPGRGLSSNRNLADLGISSQIFNPLTDLGAPDGKTLEEKKKKKPREPAPKLDAELLLSAKGFPKLRADVDKMKFKAKYSKDEDAIRDLSRLMDFYQIWAHGLYPKFTFADAAERIEKVCHERRMKVHAEEWRKFERRKLRGELFEGEQEGQEGKQPNENGDALAFPADDFDDGLVQDLQDENRPPSTPIIQSGPLPPLSPTALAKIEENRRRALEKLEVRKAAREAEERERRRREEEEDAAMLADEEAMREVEAEAMAGDTTTTRKDDERSSPAHVLEVSSGTLAHLEVSSGTLSAEKAHKALREDGIVTPDDLTALMLMGDVDEGWAMETEIQDHMFI
ncbi:chromosome segregation in meiosis- protein [Gonapodya sp. JEL0774]|nr:chromosome segregation in meiosis- protein [Gonapodya sp. JEL0774]